MKLTAKKLSQSEVDQIIQDKLEWILLSCSPLKIILFGSAAQGAMTDQSDIDLIVIFENQEDLKLINKKLYKFKPKSEWPLDILLYTRTQFELNLKKGGGVCWLANNEGKIIYERKLV